MMVGMHAGYICGYSWIESTWTGLHLAPCRLFLLRVVTVRSVIHPLNVTLHLPQATPECHVNLYCSRRILTASRKASHLLLRSDQRSDLHSPSSTQAHWYPARNAAVANIYIHTINHRGKARKCKRMRRIDPVICMRLCCSNFDCVLSPCDYTWRSGCMCAVLWVLHGLMGATICIAAAIFHNICNHNLWNQNQIIALESGTGVLFYTDTISDRHVGVASGIQSRMPGNRHWDLGLLHSSRKQAGWCTTYQLRKKNRRD